jgi:hypothetical protein
MMSNVLVIFQSDTEHTEQLALSVAVGAVEAQASIRLRRLAAPGAVEVAHKGYGGLQHADLLWADSIVVGLESTTPRTEELNDLLSLLNERGPGALTEKQGWTFGPEGLIEGRSEAQVFVESALRSAGVAILPMDILCGAGAKDLIGRMTEAGQLTGHLRTNPENQGR